MGMFPCHVHDVLYRFDYVTIVLTIIVIYFVCLSFMVSPLSAILTRTRGDGFPLAHMLSTVSSMSTKKDEFKIYMDGHLYSACPILIPKLPTPAPDLGEEELMESLGMNKDKDGKYESFDRFLARTEVSCI